MDSGVDIRILGIIGAETCPAARKSSRTRAKTLKTLRVRNRAGRNALRHESGDC